MKSKAITKCDYCKSDIKSSFGYGHLKLNFYDHKKDLAILEMGGINKDFCGLTCVIKWCVDKRTENMFTNSMDKQKEE